MRFAGGTTFNFQLWRWLHTDFNVWWKLHISKRNSKNQPRREIRKLPTPWTQVFLGPLDRASTGYLSQLLIGLLPRCYGFQPKRPDFALTNWGAKAWVIWNLVYQEFGVWKHINMWKKNWVNLIPTPMVASELPGLGGTKSWICGFRNVRSGWLGSLCHIFLTIKLGCWSFTAARLNKFPNGMIILRWFPFSRVSRIPLSTVSWFPFSRASRSVPFFSRVSRSVPFFSRASRFPFFQGQVGSLFFSRASRFPFFQGQVGSLFFQRQVGSLFFQRQVGSLFFKGKSVPFFQRQVGSLFFKGRSVPLFSRVSRFPFFQG